MDDDTGQLYGHLVAGHPGTGVGYVIPAEQIFESVWQTLGSALLLPQDHTSAATLVPKGLEGLSPLLEVEIKQKSSLALENNTTLITPEYLRELIKSTPPTQIMLLDSRDPVVFRDSWIRNVMETQDSAQSPTSDSQPSSASAPKISKQAWEDLRPLIRRLYIDENRRFKYIANVIREEIGKLPTKRQFDGKIAKWGMKKNATLEQRRLVMHTLGSAAEKVPELNGMRVSRSKLLRWEKEMKQGKLRESGGCGSDFGKTCIRMPELACLEISRGRYTYGQCALSAFRCFARVNFTRNTQRRCWVFPYCGGYGRARPQRKRSTTLPRPPP